MAMKLKPRDVQTQVKHRILEKYLGAWGGIILSGLSRYARDDNQINAHFVYVDCFSYIGKYSGDIENIWIEGTQNHVLGSPFIGIRALDQLVQQSQKYTNVNITTNVILVEEKPQNFKWLIENLKLEGLENRVKHTVDFRRLLPSEIAVINTDSTKIKNKLLDFTKQRHTWAFYLLDPYGGKGIPYEFVKSIIESDKHDVMINFIYSDLAKKAGAVVAGAAVSEKQRKHVEHWTRVFNSEEWISIKRDIEEHRESRDLLLSALGMTQEEAEYDPIFEGMMPEKALTDSQLTNLTERRLVHLYQQTLKEMDPRIISKSIKLHFPDKERPMFYLFLTTHDATGALELNKILDTAEWWEHELRYIRRSVKKQLPPEGQMSLFAPEAPPVPPILNARPPVEDCANVLIQNFSGQSLTVKEIYQGMADEEFFLSEINKALTQLKKQGKAIYSGRRTYATVVTVT